MLGDVVASFLDSVTEREFDAPFVALLRAHGFTKIHLLHGQFEFGKDMIAQLGDPPTQFVFQTKAGDINLPQWSSTVRGQVEMLRTNTLAHPDFDSESPRRAVLVLTGRLTGGAPLEVQNHADQIPEGQPSFVVWDKERLIELFENSPEAGLSGFSDGPFLELVGRIDLGTAIESQLERFSERWIGGASGVQSNGVQWRALLEAAIIANRFRRSERLDLASIASLCLLRAVWATAHGIDPIPEAVRAQRDIAVAMFRNIAQTIWDARTEDLLDAEATVRDDLGGMATYPVQCARVIEILGLYGLGEPEVREEVSAWLASFLAAQPGAAHPVSDRWAVSMIPAVLLVAKRDPNVSGTFLTEVLRWLGDRYEDGRGIAGPHAEPDEEVEYFLGGSLEHLDRAARKHSYLAAVLLDVAAALEDPEFYDLAYNEIAAVDAVPLVPLPRDDGSQYLTAGHGVDVPMNTSPNYAEAFARGDGWRMATHHDEDVTRYYLGRADHLWDHLTLSIVTRDRHWVAGLRRLLFDTAPGEQGDASLRSDE